MPGLACGGTGEPEYPGGQITDRLVVLGLLGQRQRHLEVGQRRFGITEDGQRVTAADALAGFLRALGVPDQDIPADEDERAARYRSLLAGKQMLIVLDNAGDLEQVRPLLSGTPSCPVIVIHRSPTSPEDRP